MATNVMWSYVIISTLLMTCNAFWWNPPSTTETPVQSLKQIPLGYFRTYTYQPVGAPAPYSFSILGTAAHPFSWPTKMPSVPMLSGTKYELYPLPTSTEESKPPPPLPPTPPTTTTTTTTTSTAPPSPPPPPLPTQPPLQPQDRMATPLINSANSINVASKYYDQTGSQYQGGGMYNRRSSPYYQQPAAFYRPYPYPDYTTQNQRSTVQFVPCMCPISITTPPSDLTERRTMPDGDGIVLMESTDNPNANADTAENIVDLEEEEMQKKSLY